MWAVGVPPETLMKIGGTAHATRDIDFGRQRAPATLATSLPVTDFEHEPLKLPLLADRWRDGFDGNMQPSVIVCILSAIAALFI